MELPRLGEGELLEQCREKKNRPCQATGVISFAKTLKFKAIGELSSQTPHHVTEGIEMIRDKVSGVSHSALDMPPRAFRQIRYQSIGPEGMKGLMGIGVESNLRSIILQPQQNFLPIESGDLRSKNNRRTTEPMPGHEPETGTSGSRTKQCSHSTVNEEGCQVFGTEAPSERSVRAWLQRFEAGNKKLEDEPHSGRPTAISFDEPKNLEEQHLCEGVRYFAANLGCSLSTVSNGLRSLGMVKNLGQWLPHALSDGKRQRRLDICTQLLSRTHRIDWLDITVTGDEKWVLYVNHTHKHPWRRNAGSLSVWWGV
ncbi:hypothetical protein RB195_020448 [Necator americanus]|uniref:Mos1 transposase HTH domain-containing protein n=1 Tax=Necator americanus TaxID=51031 RepID=A0ABR1CMG3_NECAM